MYHDPHKSTRLWYLWWTNKYIYMNSRFEYYLYIIMHVVSTAGVIVALKQSEYITNAIYRIYTQNTKGYAYEALHIGYFCLGSLLIYIITTIKGMVLKKMRYRLALSFDKSFIRKVSSIKWDLIEDHNVNVKIHEANQNAMNAINSIFDDISFYVGAIVSFAIFYIFLSQINIAVVIIYLCFVVISSLSSRQIWDSVRTIWDKIQPISQQQRYFFDLFGDKVAHQDMQLNRLFTFIANKWSDCYEKQISMQLDINKRYEVILQVGRLVLNIPYISMLLWVSYEIVHGKHDIGFLILCKSMFNQIVNTFGAIQYYIGNDKIQSNFIKNFLQLMNLEEENLQESSTWKIDKIVMENITYVYPQTNKPALDGLTLKINEGERIAIVGQNGSGKTTFTNILSMLATNYLGSSNLTNIAEVRKRTAILSQDFIQYQTTIRDNITIGNCQARLSEDKIWDILQKVGLEDVVRQLPDGLDTKLGQLENGVDLSKGEWQRLAIARLLANEDKTIWILDEPTAFLDPLSEIDIYNCINSLAKNRIVLFISHRLGFARKAERIIVFEDGRVIEDGRHSELVRNGHKYATMYKEQEAWYAS